MQNEARRLAEEVTDNLFGRLSSYLPSLNERRNGLQRLYEKVIGPAKDLAMTIHSAPSQYTFSEDLSLNRGDLVTKMDLENIMMIDIKTRKTLKLNSMITPDCEGFIASLLLRVVSPIVRTSSDTDARILLRKAVWLVDLLNPLGKKL